MFTKNLQNRFFILLVILGIALFFFLRLYRLPDRLNFYRDTADLLGMTREVWQHKKITALGPMVLTTEVDGRSVFYGSFYIYATLPLALIANWNPLYMSALVALAQFISIALASVILSKRVGRELGLLFFFLGATFPAFVNYSNWVWNPNYGMILTFLAIFVMEAILKKPKPLYFILLGGLTGLTLQLHWLYWLVVPIFALYILGKYKIKNLLFFVLGVGIGNSPFFIFELRNNFYNTRTIFYIMQNFGTRAASFSLPEHYYLIFFPFLPYFAVSLIGKQKKWKRLLKGMFIILIVLSMFASAQRALAGQPFGILEWWGYKDQLKSVEIISSQGEEYYNVASLIYGDTREYPIRFLLEQRGQKIIPVDGYARTNTLYVISRDDPLGHNVWEINSIRPARTIKTWEINQDVKLYKIERIKKI